MFTDKKSSWFQSSSAWTLGGVAAVALTAITSRFRIARPNERLIRTGFLCKGTNIPLRCFHIPFLQTFSRLSLEPGTFKIPIEAMSKERISFHMPTVWTLGPKEDSASLSKYAERLISMDHKQLERFYSGIIEGEGRIIAGSMELDELQGHRECVRDKLVGKLEKILIPLVLKLSTSTLLNWRILWVKNILPSVVNAHYRKQ